MRERIDSMLYERTALSKKPCETIAEELATLRDAQRMSPALVMRDPYILDFLDLRDTWQEGDQKRRSSARWNRSCWNLVRGLAS